MNKMLSGLGLALAASFTLPASAAIITLTMEGIGDNAQILNFYNGGTDSTGRSGTNYGVAFTSTAVGTIDANFGTGNFINEPTASTAMGFRSGSNAFLNYTAGFTTGFSFYYASLSTAFVDVYSGLNGAGNLLAHIDLVGQASNNCTPGPNGGDYCNWTAIGAGFTGTARSVNFGGAAAFTLFDNITLGSALPGTGLVNPIPEPSSLALVGLAIAGLGWSSRQRCKN